MLRTLAPLVLLLSIAVSAEVHAQPVDDVARARQLFVEGAKAAESGDWPTARERFEQSAKIKRAALTLYNLGIAQQETGHLVDALESFHAFLAQPVEPATQAYVTPVREVVTKLEARVARVEIEIRPAGLRDVVIHVDGRASRAVSGLWVVDPGLHEIVAVAPGHGEARQKASLPEGGHASLVLTFAVVPPPQPTPINTTLPATLGIGGLALFVGGEIVFGVGAAKASGAPAGHGAATTMMVAGNVVAGAGAIAAGVALGLLVRRVRARNTATPDLALRF